MYILCCCNYGKRLISHCNLQSIMRPVIHIQLKSKLPLEHLLWHITLHADVFWFQCNLEFCRSYALAAWWRRTPTHLFMSMLVWFLVANTFWVNLPSRELPGLFFSWLLSDYGIIYCRYLHSTLINLKALECTPPFTVCGVRRNWPNWFYSYCLVLITSA